MNKEWLKLCQDHNIEVWYEERKQRFCMQGQALAIANCLKATRAKKIIINGDASGDNRSCTSEYTNYVIIKKKLLRAGYDVDIKIKAFNPPIKNRIAAFNAKVRTADGEVCLYVDKRCEKLLYNIYNLKYREGSSKIDIPTYQQIKQTKELKFLSHPMDAASYLVDYYWPIRL